MTNYTEADYRTAIQHIAEQKEAIRQQIIAGFTVFKAEEILTELQERHNNCILAIQAIHAKNAA